MNTELDWSARISPDRDLAQMLAKRDVSVLVHNAVALEGIHFTLAGRIQHLSAPRSYPLKTSKGVR